MITDTDPEGGNKHFLFETGLNVRIFCIKIPSLVHNSMPIPEFFTKRLSLSLVCPLSPPSLVKHTECIVNLRNYVAEFTRIRRAFEHLIRSDYRRGPAGGGKHFLFETG